MAKLPKLTKKEEDALLKKIGFKLTDFDKIPESKRSKKAMDNLDFELQSFKGSDIEKGLKMPKIESDHMLRLLMGDSDVIIFFKESAAKKAAVAYNEKVIASLKKRLVIC